MHALPFYIPHAHTRAHARARERTHTHSQFRIFELFYSPQCRTFVLRTFVLLNKTFHTFKKKKLWSKEFGDFLGSRRGKRLLCCSLSWTTMAALWVSVLVVGKEAYARDAEDEQLTFLRSSTSAIVRRQRPAPGRVMLHQQQLEQAAFFLLACQWRRPKIVQPRTGWRHARQQPDFLLLFGPWGDSLSGTTTGDGAAEWIKTIVLSSPFSSTSNRRTALKLGTTDLRGLRNTLVQKN